MALRIEKSFIVEAPRATVWAFLIDPYKVAGCLPGAAITGPLDASTWGGTMTIKVGPVTASYKGKLKFERLDEAAGEAELSGAGQETKGKGGADMRMTSRVVERSPGITEVTVVSDVNVFGLLAQMGRGMIEDVSDQMFGKFSQAMQTVLAEADPRRTSDTSLPATVAVAPGSASRPAAAVDHAVLDVGALGAGAAKRAAARTLRNPAFWATIAILEGLALLYCWLAR